MSRTKATVSIVIQISKDTFVAYSTEETEGGFHVSTAKGPIDDPTVGTQAAVRKVNECGSIR